MRKSLDASFVITLKSENTPLHVKAPSNISTPQACNAKTPPLNRSSKYKAPRGLYLEIALKCKVKQSKNGKFPSNYKASPIDFENFPP